MRKLTQMRGWLIGARTRTLLYHSISDSPADPFSVSPAAFIEQMTWLSESGLQVIPNSRLVEAIRQGIDLPKTVVLTFDDAFSDFYDVAMPVLQDFGFPATVFLPTGQIGQMSKWGEHATTRKLMSMDQIALALELGFEFGSHTVNHISLPDAELDILAWELEDAFRCLQELTGSASIALAYPFGRGALREQRVARTIGYSCAYLAGGLWGNGRGSDPFALVRNPIYQNTPLVEFARHATGRSDLSRLLADIHGKAV